MTVKAFPIPTNALARLLNTQVRFRREKKFYKFDRDASQILASRSVGGEIRPKVSHTYNRGAHYLTSIWAEIKASEA